MQLVLLIVALVWATNSWAAVAHVQEKNHTVCCSQNSITITTDSNVTGGNALALAIFSDTVALSISSIDVSSCQGNTFTHAGDNPGNANVEGWGYYAANISGGACSITVTMSGTAVLLAVRLHEISGAATASPLDQHAGAVQSSPGTGANAVTTGSVTTTTNGQYIFAAMVSTGTSTPSAGTGYTGVGGTGSGISEYQVQGSAGSIAGTFTQATEGFNVASILMTFKEDAGGGSTYFYKRRGQ